MCALKKGEQEQIKVKSEQEQREYWNNINRTYRISLLNENTFMVGPRDKQSTVDAAIQPLLVKPTAKLRRTKKEKEAVYLLNLSG
jgi:hypothetical protein